MYKISGSGSDPSARLLSDPTTAADKNKTIAFCQYDF